MLHPSLGPILIIHLTTFTGCLNVVLTFMYRYRERIVVEVLMSHVNHA